MGLATWEHMGVTMSADDVLQKFVPYAERILITGCHGLLGQKLHQLLSPTNAIVGVDLSPETHLSGQFFQYIPLDITRRSELTDMVVETRPGFIINTAAMTAVDLCEEDRDQCWRVNVMAVENLIRAAKKAGTHIIQLSSDYVFDGLKPPYRETDPTRPLGFYGKSKLASENALRGSGVTHTIVRTQVLYGVAPQVRPNFVAFVLDRLGGEGELRIVDDQRGTPTLADDLARGIARIIQLRKQGIYHISGRESISRYDFATKIAQQFGEDPQRIKPIKTSELNQKAPRPPDSSFCLDKIQKELLLDTHDIAGGLREYQQQQREHQTTWRGKNR